MKQSGIAKEELIMIRFLMLLSFFIIFTTGNTGCDHDPDGVDEETSVSIVEALSEEDKAALENKLKSLDYLLSLPFEQRVAKSTEYMHKYLEFKDKDSREALEALRTSLYIHAKGDHPLLEEWVVLTHKIFREQEATLPELLRAKQIELQIARDNDENRKHIKTLEEEIEQLEHEIKDLKDQGVNPQKFKIPIEVEGDEDEA